MTRISVAVVLGLGASSLAAGQEVGATYGTPALRFETNAGQTDAQVRFLSRGRDYTLFLTPTEAVLHLQRSASPADGGGRFARATRRTPEGRESAVVRLKLLGANPDVVLQAADELPGRVNYFVGNDTKAWRRNITTHARVRYRGVYPGVDLVYYGTEGQLEYDFVVAPGADPALIRLGVEGAALALDVDGDLVARIEGGEVRMYRPVLYQESADGTRTPISGRWSLAAPAEARFHVGAYDSGRPLVIDPVIAYSTYIGARGDDVPNDIAVDRNGNVYVAGFTNSAAFPTTAGAVQRFRNGAEDGFVAKLDSTGSTLVYSTYIGGSASDAAVAIAIDKLGNAYVAGATQSTNFPVTARAFQRHYHGDNDAFIVKLDASGSALVYATYLGGTGVDGSTAIAVDSDNRAYVVGSTSSTDFPTTPGAFQQGLGGLPSSNRFDAYIAKINTTGSGLVYSTYVGGADFDTAVDVAVDARDNAYVTGTARSDDFPTTPGAFQQTGDPGSEDAFVAKLNRTGSALVYSTYLGGTGNEGGFGVAVDGRGSAYVAGFTSSADFPTTARAIQRTVRSDDGFVTKLNPAGSALVYSTYLGGSGPDAASGIAVDALGQAYVTGTTRSNNFPTRRAFQPTRRGDVDCFVAKVNATGSAFVYSSFLGSRGVDNPGRIALDTAANAYVVGSTSSREFPTTAGSYQRTFGGIRDGFVVKITDDATAR